MDLISDILLLGGALGAAFYCSILSRRLRALTSLDSGIGGAIAALSTQVDSLSKALAKTKQASAVSEQELNKRIEKADAISRRLELLIASMHDVDSKKEGR